MTEPLLNSTPKQHYIVLDSLRGVAAVIVVIFHYLEFVFYSDYTKLAITHGFLAVDFFFCLSGFVIAYAYDDRMDKIGIKRFFLNRLIRLHPLVILGSILGVILFFANPFTHDPLETGWMKTTLAILLSLLLIPSKGVVNRPDLFPFNSPAWSLFFEYIINILYALVLYRLKRGLLLIIGILSVGWLSICASQAGWLNGGWDSASFYTGLSRVVCSFTLGLLIYRYKLIIKNKLGVLIPVLLLLGAFFMPHIHNDWITEVALVVVLFPLIVGIGAGTTVSGVTHKFCDFVGRMSYPLYMTHYPVTLLFGHYYSKYRPAGTELFLIICTMIILNIIIAYLSLRWFDEPVRKWLKRKVVA